MTGHVHFLRLPPRTHNPGEDTLKTHPRRISRYFGGIKFAMRQHEVLIESFPLEECTNNSCDWAHVGRKNIVTRLNSLTNQVQICEHAAAALCTTVSYRVSPPSGTSAGSHRLQRYSRSLGFSTEWESQYIRKTPFANVQDYRGSS